MSNDALRAKIYIGFDDWKDVEEQFQEALGPEPEIIYARYDQGGYEGDANIIFKRGDQWVYVSGGHCSCYGLEGQWKEDAFDPAGHLDSVKKGRREVSMYDAGEDAHLDLDRWIEWHSRAALTPPADDALRAIRERHEALDAEDQDSPSWDVYLRMDEAHADRATLLPLAERCAAAEGKLGQTAEALGWFIEDARFRVAVGGNPNVVESMIAEAREVYHEARAAQLLKDTP